jgi:hypothetical protein
MATYTKIKLSGSTDGRGILAATTGEPGTTIHTGSSVATTIDEIWLYAVNKSTTDYKLTVQWGVTGDANDWIEQTLTGEAGLVLITPGLILQGNATTALVVRAFAANAANVILHGYVNQITA